MSARRMQPRRGFSLIELVMAIAVLGIAVAAAATTVVSITRHSADPMILQQAQLIAEAYLDEILIKRFYDPETNTVCTGTTAGETRSTYDNVCDYNALPDTVVRDQQGVAVAALAAYTVQVTVNNVGVSLNGLNNTAPTAQIRVLLVTVTVTGPGNTSVVLNGYRTNYECNTTGDAACVAL